MVLPTYVEHGQIAVSDDEEVLRCYFSDISDSEPLSREREVELALSIQGGDMDARNELIRCNLRFVVDVARRYRNRGLGFAELISAGNMGLITAAEQGRTVRLPLNKVSRLREISRAAQQLARSNEDEPDLEDIATELDVPLDEVMDVVLSARAVRSLDESLTDDKECSLLNVLADDRQELPDEAVCDDAVRSQITAANFLSHSF